MDTSTKPTQNDLQADVADLEVLEQQLAIMMEVAKLQEVAQKIEAEGTPEMKAKLKPFKEHYDGDVVTLIKKRTQQNFDNDVWQDVAKAGEEAKAKYRQNPGAYLTEEQRDEYWEKAYDKTVEEARKLAQNLEQVLKSVPTTPDVQSAATAATPRRRLFNH
jgi:hypothetical protein